LKMYLENLSHVKQRKRLKLNSQILWENFECLWNRNQQAEEREGEGRKTIRKNNGQFFPDLRKNTNPQTW
jgi:hypothetical protein